MPYVLPPAASPDAYATVTYEDVEKAFAANIGVEYTRLFSADQELFKQYVKRHLRRIWRFTHWPEVFEILAKPVSDDGEISALSDVGDIMGIFDSDPWSSEAPVSYQYDMAPDSIRVMGNSVASPVYLLSRKRVPDFDTATDEVSARFYNYLSLAAAADWLIHDEQFDRGRQLKAEAEEALLEEAEELERQEQQTKTTRIRLYYQ